MNGYLSLISLSAIARRAEEDHLSSLKRKTTGFTLVELLIVIAIIAILASMILPALRSALDKARAISCTSNHKQLGTAAFLYVDDNKGYLPPEKMKLSDTVDGARWATILWSYTTHQPITSEYAYLKQVNGGDTYEPKLSMFRCAAVLEPFNISVEMKHIGMNLYLCQAPSYVSNLFITKCRWPSARMLYSDYYSSSGYIASVEREGLGNASITYLHPGLTATITHLDGHVKAWNMHAVPKSEWDSRFWGGNPSCKGNKP